MKFNTFLIKRPVKSVCAVNEDFEVPAIKTLDDGSHYAKLLCGIS